MSIGFLKHTPMPILETWPTLSKQSVRRHERPEQAKMGRQRHVVQFQVHAVGQSWAHEFWSLLNLIPRFLSINPIQTEKFDTLSFYFNYQLLSIYTANLFCNSLNFNYQPISYIENLFTIKLESHELAFPFCIQYQSWNVTGSVAYESKDFGSRVFENRINAWVSYENCNQKAIRYYHWDRTSLMMVKEFTSTLYQR
jgi:hypothetical protein